MLQHMHAVGPPMIFRLLLLLLGVAVSSCSKPIEPAKSAILITLDTTQRDAISNFGGPNGLTPNLSKLAKKSTNFQRADTVAPLTMVAHASMLTGLYPPRHGVHYNNHSVLPASAQSLAELADEAGLQTSAFISASVLHSDFGLAQGFNNYSSPQKGKALAVLIMPTAVRAKLSMRALNG